MTMTSIVGLLDLSMAVIPRFTAAARERSPKCTPGSKKYRFYEMLSADLIDINETLKNFSERYSSLASNMVASEEFRWELEKLLRLLEKVANVCVSPPMLMHTKWNYLVPLLDYVM